MPFKRDSVNRAAKTALQSPTQSGQQQVICLRVVGGVALLEGLSLLARELETERSRVFYPIFRRRIGQWQHCRLAGDGLQHFLPIFKLVLQRAGCPFLGNICRQIARPK